MRAKRWSLSVPLDGFTLAEHGPLAREAEQLGYTDAWSFEVDGIDCFTPLAAVALATRMRVGTAIANVYTRGPATLAVSAAGLAELAPGRFCLGIGAGSQPIVETWNGGRFERPATRVREMAQILRRALAGERVVFRGETLAVDGFRLTRPPAEPVPIHIAALRPGMLRVAGEVGDGAIINWLAADDVPRSVQVVREAAQKAGRDPDSVEITARLLINVDPPSPASDLAVRRQVAGYLNVPVYRAFHEWLGRSRSARTDVGGLDERRSQGGGRRRSRRGGRRPHHPRLHAGDPGSRAALPGGRSGYGLPLRLHPRDRSRAEAGRPRRRRARPRAVRLTGGRAACRPLRP